MKQNIRKYIVASVLIAFGGSATFAQSTYKTETKTTNYIDTIDVHYYNRYKSGLWQNWSLELMGGARMLFAEEDHNLDFGKRFCPGLQFGITKDLYPDVSLRGTFGFGTLKGWNSGTAGLYKNGAQWGDVDPVRTYLEEKGTNCSNGYNQEMQFFTISADLMVNLWNVWTSNNQINRKWTPYFFLGAEYFQLMKHKGYSRTYKIGAHAGFKCDYALSKSFAITGELSGAIHDATFDNEIGKGAHNDFYASALIGIKYNIGSHGYNVKCVVPGAEYENLENVATYVKEVYQVPSQKPQVVPSTLFSPSIVFDNNANTYSEELQNVNLYRIAQYVKSNSAIKLQVIGNTHSASESLAKERAEVIKQVLVNRFGVSEDNLEVTTLDVNKEYNVTGNDQCVNFGIAK